MQRVSTNLTLFYKFFVPIFWTVFFGATTIAALLVKFEAVGDIPAPTFRIGMLLFFLTGIGFLYWAFFRLKRVEMDEQFVYVTNYFKTVRYPFHQIEKIKENDFLISKSVSIILKKKGQFGQRITFVPSRKKYGKFLNDHPTLFEELMEEEV